MGANPVLDIGGDVGALVVVLAGRTPSGELEACPTSQPRARFHTGVHRRGEGDLAAWTAVFPAVLQGRYHLLHHDGTPMAAVDVTGGRVETLRTSAERTRPGPGGPYSPARVHRADHGHTPATPRHEDGPSTCGSDDHTTEPGRDGRATSPGAP